jgi:hypothetical protein
MPFCFIALETFNYLVLSILSVPDEDYSTKLDIYVLNTINWHNVKVVENKIDIKNDTMVYLIWNIYINDAINIRIYHGLFDVWYSVVLIILLLESFTKIILFFLFNFISLFCRLLMISTLCNRHKSFAIFRNVFFFLLYLRNCGVIAN